MTTHNGSSLGMMKYYPYGSTRSGDVPTDKLFTGQRYDDTGLYYYNARYYDPEIGRFISPDTIIPNHADPQTFNRYSYCYNNPLKYTDPTGQWGDLVTIDGCDYVYVPGQGVVRIGNDSSHLRYDQTTSPTLPIDKPSGSAPPTAPVPPFPEQTFLPEETTPAKDIGDGRPNGQGSRITPTKNYGEIFVGAAELATGMILTFIFGVCVVAFLEIPVSLSVTVPLTYMSSQLAIDGWNRMTSDDYYIDGNMFPFLN